MMAGDLEEGRTLSETLQRHAGKFLPLYALSALACAEKNRKEAEVLEILGKQLAPGDEIQHQIQGTMTVPVLEFCTIITLTTLTAVFIMPKMIRLFTELQPSAPLPGITWFYLGICHFLAPFAWVLPCLLGLLLAALLLDALFTTCRRLILAGLLRIACIWPWFRSARRCRRMGRTAEALTAFLGAGADLPEALSLTGQLATDRATKRSLTTVNTRVEQGIAWADAWQSVFADEHFGNWLVRSAAALGRPREGFLQLADFYGYHSRRLTRMGLRRLEFTCLLLNAFLTAGAAFALLTPLFHIIDLC